MDVNVLERGHGYTPVLPVPSPELAVFLRHNASENLH